MNCTLVEVRWTSTPGRSGITRMRLRLSGGRALTLEGKATPYSKAQSVIWCQHPHRCLRLDLTPLDPRSRVAFFADWGSSRLRGILVAIFLSKR
jgi:hypothetical protein